MKKHIGLLVALAVGLAPMKAAFAEINSKASQPQPPAPQSWFDYLNEKKWDILSGLALVCIVAAYFCKGANEDNIIAQIEHEAYDSTSRLLPLSFTGTHYYYNNIRESFISGDCGLFAVRRLARHARLLGMNNVPDLSSTSNQELRNRMADAMNMYMGVDRSDRYGRYRKPREWLTTLALRCLLLSLNIPDDRIVFTGSGVEQDNRIPS
ncbi:MAG: hypothetical protein LBT58_01235 [Endomicrobium sp.]|jgi:hypothetical protein|nr:hypothetical protein [Endomicrobium sp.]